MRSFPLHFKYIAKGISHGWYGLISFHVCYILLNFGALFPRGLGYFAPQTRFHVNSKGKPSWCDLSSSEGQFMHYWIEILAQERIIFDFKDLYHNKQNDKCEGSSAMKSGTVLRRKTSRLIYIGSIITRTYVIKDTVTHWLTFRTQKNVDSSRME
jgi:hypothetical protein